MTETGFGANPRVLIVGAGISGLTAAAAFGQRSWQVDVIERKPVIDDGGGVGLSLVGNALRALETIGVAQQCVDIGMPAMSIGMYRPDGTLAMENPLPQIGGLQWPSVASLTRAAFHSILLRAAAKVANLRCGTTIIGVEEGSDAVGVSFSDGSSSNYDLVIGADGVYSQMRALTMPGIDPQPTGQAVWRAAVPRPAEVLRSCLYFGGRHGVVGICPVSESQAYMYIVQNYDGNRREASTLDAQMRTELAGYGGDVARLADEIKDPNSVSFRPLEWLIAPRPWGAGRIVLIGDAVHCNPPVLAQGAAMGIEDAIVIAETMSAPDGDFVQRRDAFLDRRHPRTTNVVEASCQLAKWEVENTQGVDVAGVVRENAQLLAAPI